MIKYKWRMAMNDLWLNKFQQEALPGAGLPPAVAAQFRHYP